MTDDTKYDYRRHEASLLRAPVDANWNREIYRPASDSWEKYTYSNAIEEWMYGYVVAPEAVDGLISSLKELEASHGG